MEEFLNYLIKLTEDNGEFKYNVNGTPVVDIKNGKVLVDNLTKKDKPQENCPNDDSDEKQKEDCDFISITKDVYKDPVEEYYYVREKANKCPLSLERTIVFDSVDEHGNIVPGISDLDLAFILLYRNKDDKTKYNAIVEAIKTLQ